MPTLTLEATLIYGDTSPSGAVPRRIPLTYTLTYTEESCQRVRVAADVTSQAIPLDSISAPAFLLVRSLEGDVTISLGDGSTTTDSALTSTSGYIIIANPDGQTIDVIEVTTPASPTSGALIEVIAFE